MILMDLMLYLMLISTARQAVHYTVQVIGTDPFVSNDVQEAAVRQQQKQQKRDLQALQALEAELEAAEDERGAKRRRKATILAERLAAGPARLGKLKYSCPPIQV